MSTKQATRYPEHEKLAKVSDQSQICGEFLEWILGGYEGSPGLYLCEWKEAADVPQYVHIDTDEPVNFSSKYAVQNPDWYRSGYYLPGLNTRELLARFFEIDQEKIDREKEQMLAGLRGES